MKNQYIRGDCFKRGGGLGQFTDLRGWGLAKEEGMVFLSRVGGWYPNAHYVNYEFTLNNLSFVPCHPWKSEPISHNRLTLFT